MPFSGNTWRLKYSMKFLSFERTSKYIWLLQALSFIYNPISEPLLCFPQPHLKIQNLKFLLVMVWQLTGTSNYSMYFLAGSPKRSFSLLLSVCVFLIYLWSRYKGQCGATQRFRPSKGIHALIHSSSFSKPPAWLC